LRIAAHRGIFELPSFTATQRNAANPWKRHETQWPVQRLPSSGWRDHLNGMLEDMLR
jgi:hypothetical protein